MSERYFITGVQIGLLKAYIKQGKKDKPRKLLNEIFEKQFIGNAEDGDKITIIKKINKMMIQTKATVEAYIHEN